MDGNLEGGEVKKSSFSSFVLHSPDLSGEMQNKFGGREQGRECRVKSGESGVMQGGKITMYYLFYTAFGTLFRINHSSTRWGYA